MATTVADVKRAYSNAKRPPYLITAERLTQAGTVNIWLREIAILEARIRSYASEHGVEVSL